MFTSRDMELLDPSPWSRALPMQPRFFDNSNLQTFMHCPRHFFLSAIRGLRPGAPGPAVPGAEPGGSVHLIFGSLIHEGADLFAKATAAGMSAADATAAALGHVLAASWPEGQERDVFGGWYGPVYQCDDRTKTNTRKGIVRCAHSKAEHLGAPTECPGCGGPVASRTAYLCTEKIKNRRTLARAIVALCDHLAASSSKPATLADGRVGAEVRWFQPLPLQSPDGGPYVMTGSFDRIDTDGITRCRREFKTTQREPNDKYFAGLSGSPQGFTYAWASHREEGGLGATILFTAIHLGVGFAEVYTKPVYYAREQLAEWQGDLEHYIQEAEIRARLAVAHEREGRDPALAYPRRFSACASLPGAPTTPCPFAAYCVMAPGDREAFLASNFHVETWNPLGTKGLAGEVAEDV